MRDIDKIIMERRPIFCKSCSGKLYYQNGGIYVCQDCSQDLWRKEMLSVAWN